MILLVSDGEMVRFSIATESHPKPVVVLKVYCPDAERIIEFQVYGWQVVKLVKLVSDGLMVRFNIATESQPKTVVVLKVYCPDAERIIEFQV